ncbi:MAG: HIT family hydrolase [Desulfobacterales bacterium]|nr:MAG: HIT family hydrolase [Desulfobacterales bacterium]
MKNLWTPWRMEHVLGKAPKTAHCLFEPPGDGRSSKADLLLYRDRQAVVLLNRFPYANGHLLVAPRRHIGCISELTPQENTAIMGRIQQSVGILKRHLSADGFNIGCNLGEIAGAGLAEHLHFHIVPRWEGDHNFITVLSETRAIPERIEQTFDRLLPDFLSLEPYKSQ